MELRARGVGRVLGVLVASAIGLHLVWMATRYGLGYQTMMGFGELLNIGFESSYGNWLSSLLLATTALTLLLVTRFETRARPSLRNAWLVLAFGFLYLSLDEIVTIHEHLMDPMARLVGKDGIFFHTWIVVAIPVLAILAVLYIPFLRQLPALHRWRFLGAGSVYVGGAVFVEMLSGALLSAGTVRKSTVAYASLVCVEESMEMIGVVLFIVALLAYVEEYHGIVRIDVLPQRVGRTVSSERKAAM